mmetsp:Transcript_61775/g.172533  ORF Transcript_61775/g.172533 Transcript_61775/m.172533 type:complete len:85 (-) Transcript_61775:24-278(-)
MRGDVRERLQRSGPAFAASTLWRAQFALRGAVFSSVQFLFRPGGALADRLEILERLEAPPAFSFAATKFSGKCWKLLTHAQPEM